MARSLSLFPEAFVATCRQSERSAFIAEQHGTLFAVVHAESARSELATGLASAGNPAGRRLAPSLDAMAFATMHVSAMHLGGQIAGGHADAATLRTRLARGVHFVVPLRKREVDGAKPFADRISVGRATNNDVVLRDSSVSKFHAWFQCDEQGGHYLGDARSKNGTSVNAARIAGSNLVPVASGDVIEFGSVSTFLVRAEHLWDALQ